MGEKRTNKFRYEIGDIVNSHLEITGQFRNERRRKCYTFKCLRCGFDCGEHYVGSKKKDRYMIREDVLIKGDNESEKITECPCCCVPCRVVVPKINSLWKVAPWILKLGVSEEDAKSNSVGSHAYIDVVCPNCGYRKNISVKSVYIAKSIGCNCGESASYPEKLMYEVLRQLGLKFTTEELFDWGAIRYYDFNIPSDKVVIETHGEQHYVKNNRGKGSRTLEEEQENDIFKKELAEKNGYTYISIDCRVSELEYIKTSIYNSEISKMYDLSIIDWDKCEKYALPNKVFVVCEEWNKYRDIDLISENIGVPVSTICKYLKKGANIGICDYMKNKINKSRD